MARSRPTIVHRISTSYRWVEHPAQQAMRVGSSALRAALVIQLLLSAGSPLFAQALRSSVEGRVTDQSGAVIPGAEVTLTNLETGETSVTVTNEAGRYIFPSVPVARYSLQVALSGFTTFEESNFDVAVSQRVTIDAQLQPGEITETVTVEAGGLTQALETSSNELGTLIDRASTTGTSRLGRTSRCTETCVCDFRRTSSMRSITRSSEDP
jgi:hypothetical protein